MKTPTPMRIEQLETDVLVPYARNARTHSEEQVRKIADSIQAFGWMNPVLIDGHDEIIAGHGRVMAAKLLDLRMVPCVRHTHLTDAQRRAYVLADNRLAEEAGWDQDMLRVELRDLARVEDFDLTLTGFELPELESMMADPPPAKPKPDTESRSAGGGHVVTCPKCAHQFRAAKAARD